MSQSNDDPAAPNQKFTSEGPPESLPIGTAVDIDNDGPGVIIEDFGPLPDHAVADLGNGEQIRPRRYAVVRDDDGTVTFANEKQLHTATTDNSKGDPDPQ
ncbi:MULTISPECIES: hypothetical protein [Williamsia]|uniref:Uncharacterized protein n=1 Tax=Williamsia marianensis TaxID=85044 RepID=A0A495IV89_WILMA|nr:MULTISPECIES: hypothetical protein [Williamsia]PZT95353.1 MAG: hypothetical protein DI630_24595 [Gordonia sp. (in: high G+C Gram-positive bacteria)]RKR79779.1 hypothetical protein DFJ75_4917 [Williamsia muralis]